jgi:hypothetical protein
LNRLCSGLPGWLPAAAIAARLPAVLLPACLLTWLPACLPRRCHNAVQ